MSAAVRWLDGRFYKDAADNWDDSLFRSVILENVEPNTIMLDLGAGSGHVKQMNFKNDVARVVGVDPDPRVASNRHLDEGIVGTGDKLPFDDESFDVVISDNVLEHLDDPVATFAEVARVLKPGGRFLFKTPNKYHYVPLLARLTPTAFHRYYNKLRGRDEVDTFPTRYRANSLGDVKRLAERSGLELVDLQRVEGRPEYMRLSAFTYVPGILYERVVNSSRYFEGMRVLLVGKARKPA